MSSGKFFGGSRRPVRRMGRGKGKVLAGYQGLIRGAPTPKTNPVLSKRDRFHSEVLKYIPEINEFFPRYLRYALTTRLTQKEDLEYRFVANFGDIDMPSKTTDILCGEELA